jgi:multidrug efflux pump
MISHFFIDRPIFAAVLSIVITLSGALALLALPIAQYPQITPPSVQVAIAYPGASAQVVADTVGAPIEQQVNGVEGMLYMSSQSGNDGSYTLTVTFEIGTDLNTALVMVQNRVTLAMPQLPTAVQMQGINIRKKTPDILSVISFYSPDNRYDNIYLSNYATVHIRDELLRVDGVSDINYLGERDYSIRAWLDPQKLAARGISAVDVANAIRSQNIEVAAGQVGQPPVNPGQSVQLPIDTLGRLAEPEQFADIIIKTSRNGAILSPTGVVQSPTGGGTPGGGLGAPDLTSPGSTVPSPTSPSTTNPTTTATTSGASPSPGTTIGDTSTGSALAPGTTASTPASGATTTGIPGSSTLGGGTTAGGATSSGGGTTGGAGTTSGMSTPISGLTAGGASTGGLSANGTATGGTVGGAVLNGGSLGGGPPSPATSIVRLRDVARLEMGAQNYNSFATFDGRPSVGLAIHQLPGTNALNVQDRVQQKMEELRAQFPQGLEYEIAYDTTPFIRESVLDVVYTLLEAIGLVAVVVLVFLQNWRAALIPLVAVPVAIVGTFAVMAALGYSLNNISLFGLVLAIGIVVDDAIVVVENVERWLEQGLPPREAARKAMDEVTGPVIAVALVLCAVFVPCAFIGGITGQFFRQFAVTISVSTVFSALNSLTLSPALAAILLRPHGARRDPLTWLLDVSLGWFFRGFNAVFGAGTTAYTRAVGLLLRGSVVILAVYGGLLVLTYWVFQRAPTGFVPDQDQGRVIVSVQLPDSASLQRTNKSVALVEQIALGIPGIAHTTTVSGMSLVLSANASNFGTLFVILEPFEKRRDPQLSANAIMARLRSECRRRVQDGLVTVYGAPPIPGLSVASGFKLMVEDRGGLGVTFLQQQCDTLAEKLQHQTGLVGVSSQFRSNTPQLWMDADRTKAMSLGVTIDDVNQTMQIYLGSLYVNSFNALGRYWQVTLQAEGQYRKDVRDVNLLEVRNQWGEMVPMGTLAQLREISGPVMVQRYNLFTAAPLTGNIRPGVSSGEAIDTIDATAEETLPRSMATEWTELMFLQIKAGNTAMYVFALAVMFVFLALAALYESWSLPLAVILVVPLCLLCSVGGVLLTHRAVDIFVQIGLVVLVGLACKNAILIVEFAQHLRHEGQPRYEATLEAVRLRLRPILMTSFAFILGVVPLVIAIGAGSEMRRSLGTAVFSGMLGVTLFGIFLTPVFFYVIQGFGAWRLFATATGRRIGSALLGGLLGLAIGFSLARLGLGWMPSAAVIGALVGIILALFLPVVWQRIRPQGRGGNRA